MEQDKYYDQDKLLAHSKKQEQLKKNICLISHVTKLDQANTVIMILVVASVYLYQQVLQMESTTERLLQLI